jgi:hypothetical protein
MALNKSPYINYHPVLSDVLSGEQLRVIMLLLFLVLIQVRCVIILTYNCRCVDKEGRAYAQVLENDTDSDEPTDEGVDLSKNNDKGQGGQEIIPFTIGKFTFFGYSTS